MDRRQPGSTGIEVPAIGMGNWRRPAPDQLAQLKVETWPQAVLKWIGSDPRISCVLTANRRPSRAGEPPMFDPIRGSW